MSRPLRRTDPQLTHLVTSRTQCAQLLLAPSDQVNDIIGGVFARYQEVYNVELYALEVLSNHYHFLSRSPSGLLWEFAGNVNRELAKRVNKHLGRKGPLWHRRYDDQIVVEEVDALEGLLYVVTNPTKHGLVADPMHWPGVSTYFELLHQRQTTYHFTHWTAYRKAQLRARSRGETVNLKDFQTEHRLKLSVLPYFEGLSPEEQAKELTPLIEQRTKELVNERTKNGQGFLGRKQILNQSPFNFPHHVATSPRPRCYTKNPESKKFFIEEERICINWYRDASFKFRSGRYDVNFPPYTIKPPSHYHPPNTS